MQLLPRVIKQVGGPIEDWVVPPRIDYHYVPEEAERYFPIQDLNQEAEDILANARYEAEKMLAETNQRILIMEQETYQQAYKKGEQDAWQAQQKAQEEFYQSTRKILQEVEAIRTQIYRDTEKEIVELTIDIAEKLVCRQLELKPETIVDIAKDACTQAKECEMVIIYVEPDQFESIKARQDEIAAQLYKSKRLKIIADPGITLGGCRIETELGYIDATITTMLKQLDKVLKG